MTDQTSHQELQMDFPVQGPLQPEPYFARRSPAPGVRPCKRLGFGMAYLGQKYGTPQQDEGIEVLFDAWRAGFELVDAAPGYGPAEALLGEALRRWDGRRPIIATKTAHTTVDLHEIRRVYAQSLEHLRRIDLLAVHDPEPSFPAEGVTAVTEWVTTLIDQGQILGAGLGGGGAACQREWFDAGGGVYRYAITFHRLGVATLQGLRDSVPQARERNVTVVAASPLFMGLLGDDRERLLADPPAYIPQVYVERVRACQEVCAEWSIPLTQLAVRFLLSMPFVDIVLSGAASMAEWRDVREAYEAGPLPRRLYERLWRIAQQGAEPMVGG